jgi:iron complex outermembrane recepter protein
LSSSFFLYQYDDLQKSAVVNNSLVTINTGKAKVSGAEFEGRYRVSSVGRINVSLALLNATYSQYITPNGEDFSGRRLDKAPSSTLNLGYTHNFALASGGLVTAYVGSRYSASYALTDFSASPATVVNTQKAYTKSDITLSYDAADSKFSVQLYVKNLEDKTQLKGQSTLGGVQYGYMSEPRTIGIRGTYRFE